MDFENRYVCDRKLYMEFTRNVLFRKLNSYSLFLFIVVVCLISTEALNGDVSQLSIVLALFTLLIPIISVYTGRKSFKNAKKFCNGEIPECIVYFGETIRYTEGKTNSEIDYSKVTHILNLKNIYVVQCAKAASFIVAKGKFSFGKEEDFVGFIRNKCPHAKYLKHRYRKKEL